MLIKVTSYKKSRRFNTRLNEYLTTIKKGEPRTIEAWINYHLKPQYSYFTACPFTRTQLPTITCSTLCKMKCNIIWICFIKSQSTVLSFVAYSNSQDKFQMFKTFRGLIFLKIHLIKKPGFFYKNKKGYLSNKNLE